MTDKMEEKRMTFDDLKREVRSCFQVGQTVTLLEESSKGIKVREVKALIITFYPYSVCCVIDGVVESFQYYDFYKFTKGKKSREVA